MKIFGNLLYALVESIFKQSDRIQTLNKVEASLVYPGNYALILPFLGLVLARLLSLD